MFYSILNNISSILKLINKVYAFAQLGRALHPAILINYKAWSQPSSYRATAIKHQSNLIMLLQCTVMKNCQQQRVSLNNDTSPVASTPLHDTILFFFTLATPCNDTFQIFTNWKKTLIQSQGV